MSQSDLWEKQGNLTEKRDRGGREATGGDATGRLIKAFYLGKVDNSDKKKRAGSK